MCEGRTGRSDWWDLGSDDASVNFGSQNGVAIMLKSTVVYLITIQPVAYKNKLGKSAIRDDD